MSRTLFNRIVQEVTNHSPCFRDNIDYTGEGISPLMKCTYAIRQLAYGIVPDFLDEYMQISPKSSRLSLDHFCTSVMEIFGPYLDCTDWEWFGCSYGYKAQYVRHDHGPNPFILLEVVASQDLWIWHGFFGASGLNNDINVLHQSPLFNDLKTERAPEIPFVANGVTYPWGYYLVDEIYPELVTFVKTIPEPSNDDHKRIRYKQMQEVARKDVERAFGVLKKKWAILANSARPLKKKSIMNMMYTCIILHNMIQKDQGKAIFPNWYPEEAHQSEDLERSDEQVRAVMRHISQPFIFDIDGRTLEYGREDFCLITGFRFGKVNLGPDEEDHSEFRMRVFPKIENLKGEHLLELVNKDVKFAKLDDEDVVCVCLLLALYFIFMGHELRHVVSKPIVNLVDDFYKWDAFPWGEYMWSFFHKRDYNVAVSRRKFHLEKLASNPKYEANYVLYGFVFPLKGLETFSNSIHWWRKDKNVIPRGVAWSNGLKFDKSNYDIFFYSENSTVNKLIPSAIKMNRLVEEEMVEWSDGEGEGGDDVCDGARVTVSAGVANGGCDGVGVAARCGGGGGFLRSATKVSSKGKSFHTRVRTEVRHEAYVRTDVSRVHSKEEVQDACVSELLDVVKDDVNVNSVVKEEIVKDDVNVNSLVKEDIEKDDVHVDSFVKEDIEKDDVQFDSVVKDAEQIENETLPRQKFPGKAYLSPYIQPPSTEVKCRKRRREIKLEKVEKKSSKLLLGRMELKLNCYHGKREPNVDWAMASLYLCDMLSWFQYPLYYADGVKYGVPWFSNNVQKDSHWVLEELHISSSLISIYDSLGCPPNGIETRLFWLDLREKLQFQIPLFLDNVEVFEKKNIVKDDYSINFQFADGVPI
ncbi:ulp1 protease family, C-terminal catalytic domain-containing protein [Tanacetum coccineum]